VLGILITPNYPFSSILIDDFTEIDQLERSTDFNNTYIHSDGSYFVTGRSKTMLKDVELICQNLDGEFETISGFRDETINLIQSNL
jgi:hypothetical protein